MAARQMEPPMRLKPIKAIQAYASNQFTCNRCKQHTTVVTTVHPIKGIWLYLNFTELIPNLL